MRLHDGRAVPAFMGQALRGEDITIFGSGQQTRSFCYVTDLVDGILRLMDSNVNDPVNIGNPHEMTIEQIAREILRLTGSKSKLVYRPLPEDDPKVRQPDITRARTLLGWEPKVGLEEGLQKTLAYFRDESLSPPSPRLRRGRSSSSSVPELDDLQAVVERRDDGDRERGVDEDGRPRLTCVSR